DWLAGGILAQRGDFVTAISREQQAFDRFTNLGDAKHASWCLISKGWHFLALGDLPNSKENVLRALKIAESVGSKDNIAGLYMANGTLSLCQGAWQEAVDAFQDAARL